MRKGMVHIYYGSGKGKTTAALGIILRALNYNHKICIIKFFKPQNISGEDKALKKYKNIKLIFSKYPHPQFIKNNDQNKREAEAYQHSLFKEAEKIIQQNYNIVVLDEILDLVKAGIIKTEDITGLIKSKNKNIELILTGHYINKTLIKDADLVTEMKKVKHYYDKGHPAKKGVEY